MEKSNSEEPRSFPVVHVFLYDGFDSSKKTLLRAGENNDEAGGEPEELPESVSQQMSELGLPTSFTSSSSRSPYRPRGHRKSRFHDQVIPSLVSLNRSIEEPPSLVESVQVSIGGAVVFNNQANRSAVANTLASSPASMDGEASALSCGVMVTTSAPVKLCEEVAGNFVSALGALLPNREPPVCERPKMSNVVRAESVEEISTNNDNVSDDQEEELGKEGCTIQSGEASCVDEGNQAMEANVVEPDLLHRVLCAEGMFMSSKDDGTAERVGILLTDSNNAVLVVDGPSSTTDVGHEEIEGEERMTTNQSSLLLVEAGAIAQSASWPRTAMKIDIVQGKGAEPQIAMKDDNVQVRGIGPSQQETSIIDPKSACLGDSKWSPYWDDEYVTLKSMSEPPEGFETYAYIESNKMPNSEDSLSKEIKAELKSEDSFVTDSSRQVEIMSSSMESKHQELCSAMEGEGQAVLDSENPTCQEISIETTEGNIGHVDPVKCKVDVISKQAKNATQHCFRVTSQHLNAAEISHAIHKYWVQRFSLFSKFDSGIKLDDEGWFSVTPEAIAKHQAARCKGHVIVDAFTGVGGNAIQFALAGHYVVAIDNDRIRLEYAQNNAKVYSVANRIDFVLGDFFTVSSSLKADVVFLSPPWGGPNYLNAPVYDILTMLQPKDGMTLLNVARSVAPNIILYVPRNVKMDQLADLAEMLSLSSSFEVERNYLNNKLKAVTAYYGQFEKVESSCKRVKFW